MIVLYQYSLLRDNKIFFFDALIHTTICRKWSVMILLNMFVKLSLLLVVLILYNHNIIIGFWLRTFIPHIKPLIFWKVAMKFLWSFRKLTGLSCSSYICCEQSYLDSRIVKSGLFPVKSKIRIKILLCLIFQLWLHDLNVRIYITKLKVYFVIYLL